MLKPEDFFSSKNDLDLPAWNGYWSILDGDQVNMLMPSGGVLSMGGNGTVSASFGEVRAEHGDRMSYEAIEQEAERLGESWLDLIVIVVSRATDFPTRVRLDDSVNLVIAPSTGTVPTQQLVVKPAVHSNGMPVLHLAIAPINTTKPGDGEFQFRPKTTFLEHGILSTGTRASLWHKEYELVVMPDGEMILVKPSDATALLGRVSTSQRKSYYSSHTSSVQDAATTVMVLKATSTADSPRRDVALVRPADAAPCECGRAHVSVVAQAMQYTPAPVQCDATHAMQASTAFRLRSRSVVLPGAQRAWSRKSHRRACVLPSEISSAVIVPTSQIARAMRTAFLPACAHCADSSGGACEDDVTKGVHAAHGNVELLQTAIEARVQGRCPDGCVRVSSVVPFTSTAQFSVLQALQVAVFSNGGGGSTSNLVMLLLGVAAACVGLILGIVGASWVIKRQSRSTNRMGGDFPPHSPGALRAQRMGIGGRPQLYEVYAQPKLDANGMPVGKLLETTPEETAPCMGASYSAEPDDDDDEDSSPGRKSRKSPYSRPNAIDSIAHPDSSLSPL
jgi:hypothetical protein